MSPKREPKSNNPYCTKYDDDEAATMRIAATVNGSCLATTATDQTKLLTLEVRNPKYNQIELGVERFRVAEVFFQPSIVGDGEAGLTETVCVPVHSRLCVDNISDGEDGGDRENGKDNIPDDDKPDTENVKDNIPDADADELDLPRLIPNKDS
ncbi:hypothetical protein SARC_03352 [Sphaeroforma arctica JP610]|uniref:Uncharacterized protein n=1 Tax=Sphaeroforma arctica JP610 TaxID=667725 RepID=A0A0L0G650_9EUKA|nr:hypothetical protein SARC_03352 [Sphaeroforma arctica JP610]KNC84424.1 hypothetical protein SARC_03352 [Sphaeroforma arctica JP610]|eukprot:XP_014158326.1 hypothetical protein SARC_03352 [Sphaeroforma arctica JP610]